MKMGKWKNGNPGSKEAREHGCVCPIIDNGHGAGNLGDGERFGWWVSDDCPIHGSQKKEVDN